jgi:hypothetical protein
MVEREKIEGIEAKKDFDMPGREGTRKRALKGV